MAVLFDLDGTLTDSKPGILTCLRKALAELHIAYNGPLEPFIGPPVEQWAIEILPDGDESARRLLADIYRAIYDREGWAINSVYPDIPELLATLQQQGFRLFVCTSKNERFARRIVSHFGLDRYFDGVYGDLPNADHEKALSSPASSNASNWRPVAQSWSATAATTLPLREPTVSGCSARAGATGRPKNSPRPASHRSVLRRATCSPHCL